MNAVTSAQFGSRESAAQNAAPPGDAQAWAAELGKGSSTALALTKTIINQTYELSAQNVFAQGSQAQGICYTSTEHRESVMAFLAKSAPTAKE